MSLVARLTAARERLRFRYAPKIAELYLWAATKRARTKLTGNPIGILVDSNVLGHGVTHETMWVSTGTKMWGPHDIETGYAARVPVHNRDDQSDVYANIKRLPAIAYLARSGVISLLTSAELQDEQFRQPMGRFTGYGCFDQSIFNGVPIESIDGLVFPTMGPSSLRLPSAKEQQQDRLAQSEDKLYHSIAQKLGPKQNLDAWHIRTAEVQGLFCFLTMDLKLHKSVRQKMHMEPFQSLTTKVMTPLEFGEQFGLWPAPPHLLSYDNASFFVRPDLNMPNGRRRPRKLYKRSK
ncbi:MAG: hypothetical protein ACR2QF_01060 [Geminicoccaceae bacterium]